MCIILKKRKSLEVSVEDHLNKINKSKKLAALWCQMYQQYFSDNYFKDKANNKLNFSIVKNN